MRRSVGLEALGIGVVPPVFAGALGLLVGVALVTAITCFAVSGEEPVAGSFRDEFRGDFAVDAGAWPHGGVSAELATGLEALPQVDAVAGRRCTGALVDGELTEVVGWSPRRRRVRARRPAPRAPPPPPGRR